MTRVDVVLGDGIYNAPSVSMLSSFQATTEERTSRKRLSSIAASLRCQCFSHFACQSTWYEALRMQGAVVKNAAGSVACAWVTSACYSLGNIFSGVSSSDQSRLELIVANSVWATVAFCTIVFISYLPWMLSVRFVDGAGKPPTLSFCLRRLMRATFGYFAGAEMITISFSYIAGYLALREPRTISYKLECYGDNFALLGYFTGVARVVRTIYYEETSEGRARFKVKQHKSTSPVIPSFQNSRTKIKPQFTVPQTPPRHHKPSFWRDYIGNLPSATPALLATAFVHVLSRQRIVNRSTGVIVGFAVGGLLFKLAIQELVKRHILRKRVRSTRVMCVLVGIPTVLIDTQARIILMGISSTRTAVIGSLGMALVEISLRLGKARFVKWSIYQRETALLRETATSSRQSTQKEDPKQSSLPPTSRPSLSAMHVEFEVWRRQMQAFHTAELYADVYAEYIAIGCSASILFFYSNHPHYSLLRQSDGNDIDTAAWKTDHLCMLAFQVGVEVIVDFLSFVLEMVTGIEFDHITSLGSFPAALFMVTAVMNIVISTGVYLS